LKESKPEQGRLIAVNDKEDNWPPPYFRPPHQLDYGDANYVRDAQMLAAWQARRRADFMRAAAASAIGQEEVFVPVQPAGLPSLLNQAVIIPYEKTHEGSLVRAVLVSLQNIIRLLMEDPSQVYQIDARRWEEIVAGTYKASGLFDEVTLTPRSGDYGRDVIAVRKGFGSVRLIESVKRYKPDHRVAAEEVLALAGVLAGDQRASKGIVSTTSTFAPRIMENPFIGPLVPFRLELVDGDALMRRLAEYAAKKH
jgi:restriction system protein